LERCLDRVLPRNIHLGLTHPGYLNPHFLVVPHAHTASVRQRFDPSSIHSRRLRRTPGYSASARQRPLSPSWKGRATLMRSRVPSSRCTRRWDKPQDSLPPTTVRSLMGSEATTASGRKFHFDAASQITRLFVGTTLLDRNLPNLLLSRLATRGQLLVNFWQSKQSLCNCSEARKRPLTRPFTCRAGRI
jgi:hypothetical protein